MNRFIELNKSELLDIDAGGFWSGLASVAGGIGLSLAAVVVVATAPLSTAAAVACGAAYLCGKAATAVGIADMVTGD